MFRDGISPLGHAAAATATKFDGKEKSVIMRVGHFSAHHNDNLTSMW